MVRIRSWKKYVHDKNPFILKMHSWQEYVQGRKPFMPRTVLAKNSFHAVFIFKEENRA
jgi:hypothetical protein